MSWAGCDISVDELYGASDQGAFEFSHLGHYPELSFLMLAVLSNRVEIVRDILGTFAIDLAKIQAEKQVPAYVTEGEVVDSVRITTERPQGGRFLCPVFRAMAGKDHPNNQMLQLLLDAFEAPGVKLLVDYFRTSNDNIPTGIVDIVCQYLMSAPVDKYPFVPPPSQPMASVNPFGRQPSFDFGASFSFDSSALKFSVGR